MSSTKAIGLASPTMPISSENPALRTFQKSSLSASTRRVRTPRTPGRPSNRRGQVVGALGQLIRRVGVELGGQNGRRAALGEVQMLGERRVLRGQVEDHPVEHLDGDRTGLDDLGQAIERRRDRREREHDQPLRRRQRDELQHGGGGDRQRPLRADDQLGQVELPGLLAPARRPDRQARDELVEVVAADPPQDVREPLADRLRDASATVSRTTR